MLTVIIAIEGLLFFFLIDIWLKYNVMLISGVQDSDSVTHTYIFITYIYILHTYIYILFISFSIMLLQDIDYSSLCYTLGHFYRGFIASKFFKLTEEENIYPKCIPLHAHTHISTYLHLYSS